jgi:hypothetical protein
MSAAEIKMNARVHDEYNNAENASTYAPSKQADLVAAYALIEVPIGVFIPAYSVATGIDD